MYNHVYIQKERGREKETETETGYIQKVRGGGNETETETERHRQREGERKKKRDPGSVGWQERCHSALEPREHRQIHLPRPKNLSKPESCLDCLICAHIRSTAVLSYVFHISRVSTRSCGP